MIRLPESLTRRRLDEVRRGTIIRFWWEEAGKHKFGVMVNASWPEADILLVIATSQLAFYERVDAEADIHRVDAGSYDCFPKNTVINLRQVIEIPVSVLLEGREFTIEDVLHDADLASIERKIAASKRLSRSMKRRVLPASK